MNEPTAASDVHMLETLRAARLPELRTIIAFGDQRVPGAFAWEEVVARALEGRANKPYVFTKCERTWNEKGEIQKVLKE